VNKSFYEAVLPPTGPYCAVGILGSKVRQTFHTTIDELEARGDELVSVGLNAYFALASFSTTENRDADNARELRSFFLDLDAGPHKVGKKYAYREQADAAVALREFLTVTGLPEPTVISSGYGLHVYWILTEAIPATLWRSHARRFKKLCLESDAIMVDPAVPADAARVLRMPDTRNLRPGESLPVEIMSVADPISLDEFLKALPPAPPDLTAAKAAGMDAMTLALAQGDYPPSEFARIVRKSVSGVGCAQIATALTEAETLEEPLWRAALSIAWRCTDAETAIHKLSSAHPEYTPEKTVAKASGTKGPMTCQWYRDNYPDGCAGCTQTVTSPIVLGKKIEAAPVSGDAYIVEHNLNADNDPNATGNVVQVSIPTYPFPYFRGANGGVYLRTRDKKGNPDETEVYRYDLYVTGRQYDSSETGDGEGELVCVHLHTPHDGIRRFVAPVSHLLVREKMRDLLLKHGVIALPGEMSEIMSYLAASIKNLQKLYAADRTRNQMGWAPDLSGFVVGELEYVATGIRLAPAASATRNIAPALIAKGSLEKWSEIANFYGRPGLETHALALFFGFGSVLLRLYGGIEVRGAMINLMSNKSGTGKTTVQTVINSIFGHPSELLLKKDDTVNARMQWMGLLNHIPVTMDEVTNLTDEELSGLVYDIPQGRGRHRMESQSNKLRANTTTWQNFAISSSNSSMYDKLLRFKSTADGELRRLIELRITRPMDISKAESDAVFKELSLHYGLAGPKFVQYVMKNRAEVDEIVERFRMRFDADLELDQSDRFHAKAFTLALAGGFIARKIGLINIDVQAIYKAAVAHLRSIRRDVIAPVTNVNQTTLETLGAFLNENIQNALVINGAKTEVPTPAVQIPRGPLRLRFEPDTKEIWIPCGLLRDYFVERQVDVKHAVHELASCGVMKYDGNATAKRIGSGALFGLEASSIRSYCFDAEKLGMDLDAFTVDTDQAPDT